MGLGLITCGEVKEVVSVLTPLLAKSHRFSTFFLSSSGCCSSLRWKKGTDRRKAEKQRVEEVESKRNNHVDGHGDGVKGARLSLSQMSMNDQGRSVTMRALMRALSGSACGCPCCEAPRNRRCAVCACHPRRHWCSHSGLSPTCIVFHFMSRFSSLCNSFNSLFSHSHFFTYVFTVFSRHFRCGIYRITGPMNGSPNRHS